MKQVKCQWFARCTRPAVTSVPHPVLGEVPCCQKCADFARGTPKPATDCCEHHSKHPDSNRGCR